MQTCSLSFEGPVVILFISLTEKSISLDCPFKCFNTTYLNIFSLTMSKLKLPISWKTPRMCATYTNVKLYKLFSSHNTQAAELNICKQLVFEGVVLVNGWGGQVGLVWSVWSTVDQYWPRQTI